MNTVIIKVRPSGPFVVDGPFQLLDGNGNAFAVPEGKAVSLCRCGQSKRRPFCDGTHRTCGFVASETAPAP